MTPWGNPKDSAFWGGGSILKVLVYGIRPDCKTFDQSEAPFLNYVTRFSRFFTRMDYYELKRKKLNVKYVRILYPSISIIWFWGIEDG